MEAGQEQAGHAPHPSQLSALRAPRPPWPFSASSPGTSLQIWPFPGSRAWGPRELGAG